MNNNPQPHHMLVLAAAILTAIAVCASAVESQDLQHGIGTMTDLSPVADAGLPSLSSAGRRNNADDAATTPPSRRRQPIPDEEWTPETRVTLARCVVGESGWTNHAEHVEHAAALANRWREMRAQGKGATFRSHVVKYCAALRSSRTWILEMHGDGTVPEVISRRAGDWKAALATVDAWAAGEVLPTCSDAEHWAGNVAIDKERASRAVASGKWRPAKCAAKTANKFYVVNRGER